MDITSTVRATMTAGLAPIRAIGEAAKAAARSVAKLPEARRTAALEAIAAAIDARSADILAANRADLDAAVALGDAFRDRLALDPARVAALARAVREIAAQPALVGRVERAEQ